MDVAPPPSVNLEDSQAYVQSLLSRIQSLEAELAGSEHHNNACTSLETILNHAGESPELAHDKILGLAQKSESPRDKLLLCAKLCLYGPVGRIGHRSDLRVVANLLLDTLLEKNPIDTEALCMKGEALLPPSHYGRNDPFTPRTVLKEAYVLFSRASANGSALATFLMGRWLLANEFLHKDPEQVQLGRDHIVSAANRGCARALAFLAQEYFHSKSTSSPYFKDIPKGKMLKEHRVLELYIHAAKLGDGDALNDIGASFAQGYGGLPLDFDKAVLFYKAAITQGCLMAYDNIGTHYETGMDNHCPDRVDHSLALRYYHLGVKKRCPKCAYNLGAAFEEGMGGLIKRDVRKAENYYLLSLRLAHDANDAQTGGRVLYDLAAFYITRVKLDCPDGEDGLQAMRCLTQLLRHQETINGFIARVNSAIATCQRSRGNRYSSLAKVVGDQNAKLIMTHLRALEKCAREGDALAANQVKYILGTTITGEGESFKRSTRVRGSTVSASKSQPSTKPRLSKRQRDCPER